MSNKKKKRVKIVSPDLSVAGQKKYEDYVAIKDREAQEVGELEAMMEQPDPSSRYNLDFFHDDNPEDDLPTEVYRGELGIGTFPKSSAHMSLKELADGAAATDEGGYKKMSEPQVVIPDEAFNPGHGRKLVMDDGSTLKTYQNTTAQAGSAPSGKVLRGEFTGVSAPTSGPGFPQDDMYSLSSMSGSGSPQRAKISERLQGDSVGSLDPYYESSSSERYPSKYQAKRQFRQMGRNANFLDPAMKIVDDNDREEVLPEVSSDKVKEPNELKTFEAIRNSFRLIRIPERTMVYAVVRSKKEEIPNTVAKIRCCGGIAFGGYAREASSDSFVVECVSYIHLGTIPFGYRLEVPKTGSWTVNVPVPEEVLEKVLTPSQRKALGELREKYADNDYEIFYLQMLLSN